MSKGKILIVEDENIVALDLKRRLLKLGYNVVGTASNAAKALKCVAENAPDLVLMDIRIQGRTDGIETAKLIHESYSTPVVFLTAHSEEPTLQRALESMPYGYLLKPCSERELHANIQLAMEKGRVDQSLKTRQQNLQIAMNAGSLATVDIDPDADSAILTYTPSGQLAETVEWNTLVNRIVPEDINRVTRQILYLKGAPERQAEVDFRVFDSDARHRHLAMFAQSVSGPGGTRIIGALQDITERQVIAANLEQAAREFTAGSDAIALLDGQLRIVSANEAYCKLVEAAEAQVTDTPSKLLDPAEIGGSTRTQIAAALEQRGNWAGAVDCFYADGRPLHAWVNISAVPMTPGQPTRHVLMAADINRIFEMRDKLSNVSLYDALTRLPNRNLFLDRLGVALARAEREQNRLALIYLDLDNFKRINDSMGHQVGDAMLRSVAGRLKAVFRTADTLCRIGGDEFIAIIEGATSESALEAMSQGVMAALDQPLLLGNTEVIPSASIGISIFPDHSRDRDDLIKMADSAMYSAKNSGRRRYAFYNPEMTEASHHYLHREMELRSALQNHQFELFYQPRYDPDGETIAGLEALIRWRHPERGLLAAGEVIPVAEKSDLIVSIGNWVVDEVCRQYRAWTDAGHSPPRMAFNVSPRQMMDSHFVNTLAEAIEHHRIPPGSLEIEITESCLQDNEAVIQTLREVARLGATVSIDDFGTGYSCLSSIKSLPIHRLKIDQSFVRDIPRDDSACAITTAIIALGQKLGLQVTAEGIETDEQAEFARENNCNEMQGFLFSRPVPVADITALLARK